MKTNYTINTAFLNGKLFDSKKEFISRKMYVALLFFMLVKIISTQAQIGKNDSTFNTGDSIAAPGINKVVHSMAAQSPHKIIIASGESAGWLDKVKIKSLSRIKGNGKNDDTFMKGSGVDGFISSLAIQTDEKIIIVGRFSTYNHIPSNNIARLNPDGTIDQGFTTGGIVSDSGFSNILLQPDGKIIVSGEDSKVLVRLNINGNLDTSFHAIISDTMQMIKCISLQPDGKIIVAGLTDYNSGFIYKIWFIRLNADGSRDFSFEKDMNWGPEYPYRSFIIPESDGNILIGISFSEGSCCDGMYSYLKRVDPYGNEVNSKYLRGIWTNALLIQGDEKIIVAGYEQGVSGFHTKQIIRFNKDFTTDTTFTFHAGFSNRDNERDNEFIIGAAILQNEKIVIGGAFSEINGLIANQIARIHADGSFDHSFNERSGCNGRIFTSAIQTDKKVIIGGAFNRYNSIVVTNIVRLAEDGNIDPSFLPGTGVNGEIYSIAIQQNGKIIIGGVFSSYNGNNCQNIARLNSDGTFDATFSTSTNDIVRKIVIDSSRKIFIGGDFSRVNGSAINGIARVLDNGKLDATFNSTLEHNSKVFDCIISKDKSIYLAVNHMAWLITYYLDYTEIRHLDSIGNTDSSLLYMSQPMDKIYSLAFNNDGKILVGGRSWVFRGSYPNGHYKGVVSQLNVDASVDTTFDHTTLAGFADQPTLEIVRIIKVLDDNKIVLGGDFEKHICLLNSDGTLDTTFVGNTDYPIYTAALQGDDKMIIAGAFSEYTSIARNSIARIILKEEKQTQNILDINTAKMLNIYPNPASSEINVTNLNPGSVLKVYNSIGKEVYSKISTDTRSIIELSNYSNGIYFIITENNGVRTSSTKFIVSK